MANTIIRIPTIEDSLPTRAYLTPNGTGQVSPAVAGYVMSLAGAWLYEITVPEACVGVYAVEVQDVDGLTVATGWVNIEADDALTYTATGDYHVSVISPKVSEPDAATAADAAAAKVAAEAAKVAAEAAKVAAEDALAEIQKVPRDGSGGYEYKNTTNPAKKANVQITKL